MTPWSTSDLLAELSAMQVGAAMDDDDTPVVGCSPFSCRVTGDPDDEDGDG